MFLNVFPLVGNHKLIAEMALKLYSLVSPSLNIEFHVSSHFVPVQYVFD